MEQEIPEELSGLPPAARQQVLSQLEQLQAMTDAGQLRAIREQLEGQVGAAPENFRPAMEYMLRRLTERIETLESTDTTATDDGAAGNEGEGR